MNRSRKMDRTTHGKRKIYLERNKSKNKIGEKKGYEINWKKKKEDMLRKRRKVTK